MARHAPEQSAAQTVGVRTVLGVDQRSVREPCCRSAVDQRLRIVRVHDVRSMLGQEASQAQHQPRIESVRLLGQRTGIGSHGTKSRRFRPFGWAGERNGEHAMPAGDLASGELDCDALLAAGSE
jgi:hypothetical protein